ncbi:MAG: SprB repeat-containing protein, partial [Ferruginibacter sp.]|nr:SprB repeat-containing protein [Ferruginibacter sp.]
DANGCTTTVAATITQPAAALVATSTHTNVLCFDGTTGTATISATGGTAPYTGTGTFTALAAGTYSYTVTDANSCTTTISVTIGQPTVLNAVVTAITNIGCGVSSGSVTVTATGGTPEASAPFYQYRLDAGAYQTSGTFNGITAGAHSVTAKDANGCTKVVTFTITQLITTDISLGSTFDNNLFSLNGDEINMVYNISELGGSQATPSTLRIFKPSGYNIIFTGTLTNVTLGNITYTVDNTNWTLTNTTSLFQEFTRTGTSNVVPCSSLLRVSFKLKRNTLNKSIFNLNAQFRLSTGEVITANNTNSIIFTGE